MKRYCLYICDGSPDEAEWKDIRPLAHDLTYTVRRFLTGWDTLTFSTEVKSIPVWLGADYVTPYKTYLSVVRAGKPILFLYLSAMPTQKNGRLYWTFTTPCKHLDDIYWLTTPAGGDSADIVPGYQRYACDILTELVLLCKEAMADVDDPFYLVTAGNNFYQGSYDDYPFLVYPHVTIQSYASAIKEVITLSYSVDIDLRCRSDGTLYFYKGLQREHDWTIHYPAVRNNVSALSLTTASPDVYSGSVQVGQGVISDSPDKATALVVTDYSDNVSRWALVQHYNKTSYTSESVLQSLAQYDYLESMPYALPVPMLAGEHVAPCPDDLEHELSLWVNDKVNLAVTPDVLGVSGDYYVAELKVTVDDTDHELLQPSLVKNLSSYQRSVLEDLEDAVQDAQVAEGSGSYFEE